MADEQPSSDQHQQMADEQPSSSQQSLELQAQIEQIKHENSDTNASIEYLNTENQELLPRVPSLNSIVKLEEGSDTGCNEDFFKLDDKVSHNSTHADCGDNLVSGEDNFQDLLGGLSAYVADLSNQRDKANQKAETLKANAIESNEHAIKVASENYELQKKCEEFAEKNEELKAKLTETAKDNVDFNQKLHSEFEALKQAFEQLQVDKKLADEKLVAEKENVASLKKDNSKACAKLKSAQKGNEDLKLKMAKIDKSNNASNRKLQSEFDVLKQQTSDLEKSKNLVESKLVLEKETVTSLMNYNSKLCEKLKLSEQGNEEWKAASQVGITFQRIKEAFQAIDLPKRQFVKFIGDMEARAWNDITNDKHERAADLLLKVIVAEELGRQNESFLCCYWKKTSLCYYRSKCWEQALQAAEKAAEYRQFDPSIFYERGLIHKRIGNRDQAIADLKRSLELEDFHAFSEDAKKLLSKLGCEYTTAPDDNSGDNSDSDWDENSEAGSTSDSSSDSSFDSDSASD